MQRTPSEQRAFDRGYAHREFINKLLDIAWQEEVPKITRVQIELLIDVYRDKI